MLDIKQLIEKTIDEHVRYDADTKCVYCNNNIIAYDVLSRGAVHEIEYIKEYLSDILFSFYEKLLKSNV